MHCFFISNEREITASGTASPNAFGNGIPHNTCKSTGPSFFSRDECNGKGETVQFRFHSSCPFLAHTTSYRPSRYVTALSAASYHHPPLTSRALQQLFYYPNLVLQGRRLSSSSSQQQQQRETKITSRIRGFLGDLDAGDRLVFRLPFCAASRNPATTSSDRAARPSTVRLVCCKYYYIL